jgi:hypothetical protein
MQQVFQCSSCGAQNNAGEQFCWNCGNRFQQNCPYCRAIINPALANCHNCGAFLAYQQPQPPPVYQQPPAGHYPMQQQGGWGQQPAWGQPLGFNPYQSQGQQGFYGYGMGAPRRQGTSSGLVFLVVFAIILLLGGAWGVISGGTFRIPSFSTSSPATTPSTPSSTPTPTPTPAPAPKLEVSAKELADAFKANKAAAETKYKGQIIKVTGSVAGLSASGTIFVLLTSGTPDESGAKCLFTSKDASAILSLEPAQNVTIEGKVGDYNVDVMLTDCTFIK